VTDCERLKFFTELACVAMKHDPQIMCALIARLERRIEARKKNTGSGAAKKGPKNLLAAAASVQGIAA